MSRFHDDTPIKCDACDEYIYAGESARYYQGHVCHNKERCMKNILFLVREEDFDEEYLMTAEDKEIECYE